MRRRQSLARDLTENGRVKGSGWSSTRRIGMQLEVTRKEMKLARGEYERRDKLGHLWRFLMKHVGKPWDATFSKLVAKLRGDGQYHRNHVMDHLYQWVDATGEGPGRGLWLRATFCVDAAGILRQPHEWRQSMRGRRRDEEPLESIALSENCSLVWRSGYWFEATHVDSQIYSRRSGATIEPSCTYRQLSRSEMQALYREHPRARRDEWTERELGTTPRAAA